MASTEGAARLPTNYRWERTLVAMLGAVILTLSLVTHLTARVTPPDQTSPNSAGYPKLTAPQSLAGYGPTASQGRPPPALTLGDHSIPTRSTRLSRAPPSDPLQVVIGPSSISGQFELVAANRTKVSATSDKLTLHLRVVSRAMADLVTPFQSAMLEVRAQGLDPISPEQPFSYPVHAGDTRDEDIAFMVPSSLNIDQAVLRIHYYNELKEIPLALLPPNVRR